MKMIRHALTFFGIILAIIVSVSVSYDERVTKWDQVKYKETMSKYEQVLQKPNTALYKRLAKEAKNATRDVWVQETLKRAAGVYKDKARGKELGIEKTVFISVIAYPVGAHHYKVYFRNFLCFIHHYGYDLVVYVVHQGDVDPDVEIQSLRKLGVSPLTYPDELFWKVVSNKMQPIHQGATYAKYNGTKVSFQEFGALPMLVPALEVLEYGYNIIYFDVDIALVHDPVPYLIRGDADFVASIENRACREEYYGMVPSKIDWERIEPNTGIMHLRATKQGLKFFAWWLERIVDNNFVNDQRALSRRILNATYVSNCLAPDTPGVGRFGAVPSTRKDPDAPTYCLLSDIAFQNGMVGLTCQSKRAFHDNWLLSTYRHGVRVADKAYPVTLHVNFCNGKTNELNMRNLWLYKEHERQAVSADEPLDRFGCKAYRLNETYYSRLDWTGEVKAIEEKINQTLSFLLVNGTFVKRDGAHEIFMIWGIDNNTKNLRKRSFPDGDTFLNLGYDFDKVHLHNVAGYILERVPDGDPFPSTLDWSKSTDYVKMKKKQAKDSKDYVPFSSPNIEGGGGKAI